MKKVKLLVTKTILINLMILMNLNASEVFNEKELYSDKNDLIRLDNNDKLVSGKVIKYYTNHELNENIIRKTEYKNGKKDGDLISHYESGELFCKSTYKKNILISNEVCLYKSGMIYSKFEIENLKKKRYKEFYPNGQLLYVENYYENNNKEYTTYNEDGTLYKSQKISFTEDYKLNVIKYFYKNSNILFEITEQKNFFKPYCLKKCYKSLSNYKSYYKNGNVEEEYNHLFLNLSKYKLKHGLYKYFHKNGNLKFIGNYNEGIPEGNYKIFDEDNNLIEESQFTQKFKIYKLRNHY